MPDHGTSLWLLDELSGTVVDDANNIRNGTYFDTAHIEHGIPVPNGTVGTRFNHYYTGQAYYQNPISSSGFDVSFTSGGYGNMDGLQEFTVIMKVSCHSPILAGGPSGGVSGGSLIYANRWGVSMNHNYISFFRRNNSTANILNTSNIYVPAGTAWNSWDDFNAGIYQEPYKVSQWFTFGIRFNGLKKSIWIDGTKVAEDTANDTVSVNQMSGTINFQHYLAGGWGKDLAEVGLWHQALTDPQMGG